MITLDTDHVTVLQDKDSPRRRNLVSRMAVVPDEDFSAGIPVVEERLRGWLASIAKERHVLRQIKPYAELQRIVEFFSEFTVLPFDDVAANHFDRLRPIVPRVGTMDLKIACCAIAVDALLLTANRRDFEQVPGLRFENWLD